VIRLKRYLLEIAYRELLEENSMHKEIYDVIVVGAGIVGCSTSYHLARSGLKVSLVDKGSAAGEASQTAAGMLAPLGDEPPDQEHPLQ
jgi:glycine oxidase